MNEGVIKVSPDLAFVFNELLTIPFRSVGGDGVSVISGVLRLLDTTNLTLDSQ